MIHPTAVIHPKARLDSTVSVGPYSVIDKVIDHIDLGTATKERPKDNASLHDLGHFY